MVDEKCFQKKVVSNSISAFWIIISGILLFFPILIWGYWSITFPEAEGYKQAIDNLNTRILWGGITAVLDMIWMYIIGLPIVECYIHPIE